MKNLGTPENKQMLTNVIPAPFLAEDNYKSKLLVAKAMDYSN